MKSKKMDMPKGMPANCHEVGEKCLNGSCPMNAKKGPFMKKYKSAMPNIEGKTVAEIKEGMLSGGRFWEPPPIRPTNAEMLALSNEIKNNGPWSTASVRSKRIPVPKKD